MNYIYIIIPCALALLVIIVIILYNKLIKCKIRMQEAWSIIDVCLKKRYDLVPNLVEIVKGYATHEKATLDEIVRCRSAAMQATNIEHRIESEKGLGQALGSLIAVVESYPELKANNSFLDLQHQLSDIEEELSMARRYYNGTVRENNICIESFPSNLVAGIFKFNKGKFFITDSSEKNVPIMEL